MHHVPGRASGIGPRIFVAVVMLCAIYLVSSCTTGADKQSTSAVSAATGTAASGDAAVLDWSIATITLPLDRYGMTPAESVMVDTAAKLDIYLCQTGRDTVEQDVVQEASQHLSTNPPESHWLWGRWDAPYVAKYGPMGEPGSVVSFGGLTSFDDPCATKPDQDGLNVVSATMIGSTASSQLASALMDTYDEALADPAYLSLAGQRNTCIEQAGYTTNSPSDGGGVQWISSWTDEQVLQAVLVEAQCSDAMSYTQQVADITAAYQTTYISEHQAELVAIKQQADNAVAKAKQFLAQVGVA